MKTLILSLILMLFLVLAPAGMAQTKYSSDNEQNSTNNPLLNGYPDVVIYCSEMTTEAPGILPGSLQSRIQPQSIKGISDTSDALHNYDFVIDHHKSDWIIRCSESDP